jgi:hypothetical protein
MNTLTLALLSAFTALDQASETTLTETVDALREMVTNNVIDDWIADDVIDAIEGEVESRTGTLLDDGFSIDAFDAVSEAIANYRNS